MKFKLITVTAFILVLLTSTTITRAQQVTLNSTPPSDLGDVPTLNDVTFGFNVTYSNAYQSEAMIRVNFTGSAWTYAGFAAEFNGANATSQFDESTTADSVLVNCTSITTANGTLTVDFTFTAGTTTGTYLFNWTYAFVAYPSGPAIPDTELGEGNSTAEIVDEVITVTADAQWSEPTDTVDIAANATSNISGEVTSGTGYYEVYSSGDVYQGLTGAMTYSGVTSQWEALAVDTSTLANGGYYAHVNISDPEGHWGTDNASFTVQRLYTVTVQTSGLDSASYTTHIWVNDTDQGTPYLWDGLPSRSFNFNEDDVYNITVQAVVLGGTGTRYICSQNTVFTSGGPSDESITFNYTKQHLLTLATNHGIVSANPLSVDGYYDAGTSVQIQATAPATGAGERYYWLGWTGSGTGSYTGLDNPVNVTMNSPITETAAWEHQYTLTVTSDHGSPNPPVGVNWIEAGASVTASVPSPADQIGGTRYRCTGWNGTGSAPASGTGTSTSFTLNTPSGINWNWIPQYRLTLSTNPSGLSPQPTAAPAGPWYDNNTEVTLTAYNVADYMYMRWMVNGAPVSPMTVDLNMTEPVNAVAYYSTFNIAVDPTGATVKQGESATATVELTPVNGFIEIVNLMALNVPGGVTINFTPGSGTPYYNSQMDVLVDSSAASGTYPITVLGHSCSVNKTAVYTLTVGVEAVGGELLPSLTGLIVVVMVAGVVVAGASILPRRFSKIF